MLDPIIIGRNIQHRIQQYPVNTTYNNDKIWTMDLPAQVGSRDDALTTVEQNCLAIWIIICDKTYSIRNTYRFYNKTCIGITIKYTKREFNTSLSDLLNEKTIVDIIDSHLVNCNTEHWKNCYSWYHFIDAYLSTFLLGFILLNFILL